MQIIQIKILKAIKTAQINPNVNRMNKRKISNQLGKVQDPRRYPEYTARETFSLFWYRML